MIRQHCITINANVVTVIVMAHWLALALLGTPAFAGQPYEQDPLNGAGQYITSTFMQYHHSSDSNHIHNGLDVYAPSGTSVYFPAIDPTIVPADYYVCWIEDNQEAILIYTSDFGSGTHNDVFGVGHIYVSSVLSEGGSVGFYQNLGSIITGYAHAHFVIAEVPMTVPIMQLGTHESSFHKSLRNPLMEAFSWADWATPTSDTQKPFIEPDVTYEQVGANVVFHVDAYDQASNAPSNEIIGLYTLELQVRGNSEDYVEFDQYLSPSGLSVPSCFEYYCTCPPAPYDPEAPIPYKLTWTGGNAEEVDDILVMIYATDHYDQVYILDINDPPAVLGAYSQNCHCCTDSLYLSFKATDRLYYQSYRCVRSGEPPESGILCDVQQFLDWDQYWYVSSTVPNRYGMAVIDLEIWGQSNNGNYEKVTCFSCNCHCESDMGLTVKAYPNPFSDRTSIQLAGNIPTGMIVGEVYDVSGRSVSEFSIKSVDEVGYQRLWDGKDKSGYVCTPGVYMVVVKIGSKTVGKTKVVKIR